MPQLSLRQATPSLPAICADRRGHDGEHSVATTHQINDASVGDDMRDGATLQPLMRLKRIVSYTCGLRDKAAPRRHAVSDDHPCGRQVARRTLDTQKAAAGDSTAATRLPVRYEGGQRSQIHLSVLCNAKDADIVPKPSPHATGVAGPDAAGSRRVASPCSAGPCGAAERQRRRQAGRRHRTDGEWRSLCKLQYNISLCSG